MAPGIGMQPYGNVPGAVLPTGSGIGADCFQH